MSPQKYIPPHILPYLRFAPTVALFAGLVFDLFTLDRPDAIFENTVIIGYLLIAAITMSVLHYRAPEKNSYRHLVLLSILQFSFGNLASALMILYSRSGTLTGSAIFIVFLAALFLGNELFKTRYARIYLRISIFFILLTTYLAIAMPVLLNRIGVTVFLISVAASLVIMMAFIWFISRLGTPEIPVPAKRLFVVITGIAIIFVSLFFTNLIPPVPLAVKEIGIYHSVARSGDTYFVEYEKPQWYEFWLDTDNVYSQPSAGTPTYCFASIYAPSELETQIRHRWERFNTQTETWITVAYIPFSITGGRENGFRGFTLTSQVTPGEWRCSVETSRGSLIGRTQVTVLEETPDLTKDTR